MRTRAARPSIFLQVTAMKETYMQTIESAMICIGPPAPTTLDQQQKAATRVAVVIVNWNGWRECIECLNSLFAQSHGNIHAFVVDNDSHDDSVGHILSWCGNPGWDATWRRHPGVGYLSDQAAVGPIDCRVVDRPDGDLPAAPAGCRLTIVRSGANLGFAGGCNVGVRAAGLAGFEYFWFL